MTKHTDTSRSGDLVDDDFAPIWDESILLAEHEAVQASVAVGGWLSAALDDPNVCDAMKADINRWFSAGFLYLDEVRKLMQTEREALEAEIERLREALRNIRALATKRQNVCGPDGCLTDIECFASAALGEKQ